jgi:hypothetical protein
MLLDNNIQEKREIEKQVLIDAKGSGSADTTDLSKVPLINKIAPKIEFSVDADWNKTKKIVDSVNVVSTKSTMLNPIYIKAIEAKELKKSEIGNLIKIRNVELNITNEKEILTTKSLLSGVLNKVPIEGTEGVDITGFLEVLLKDSAYIFSGKFKNSTITFKIPMKVENEMESQYSITDLEIGPVTIIGIYRGKHNNKKINKKINRLQNLSNFYGNEDSGLEHDEEDEDKKDNGVDTHFIDVIAIIQELNIK